MEANPLREDEPIHHQTIDTQKMSKPVIKVIKAPPSACSQKKGDFFQLNGEVFQVYEAKTRGRFMIKFLGFPDTGEGLIKDGSGSPT